MLEATDIETASSHYVDVFNNLVKLGLDYLLGILVWRRVDQTPALELQTWEIVCFAGSAHNIFSFILSL